MKSQQGFSLIELAIVLVIVTLLVGGLAMPLSAQIQARRIAETKKTMEEAREAIMGYAMSNTTTPCTCAYTSTGFDTASSCAQALCTARLGAVTTTGDTSLILQPRHYLPCPDVNSDPEPGVDNDGDGIQNDANNGREDRYVSGTNMGDCVAASGNLPWVTLAIASQDAWGNRFHYALTSPYGNRLVGFNNSNNGDKQICGRSVSPGCTTGLVADQVPLVLASYGPNGWGARNINDSSFTRTAPTSADELENTDPDVIYVSRSPTQPGVATGEFDDLLVWTSKEILISRVCPTPGGCP